MTPLLNPTPPSGTPATNGNGVKSTDTFKARDFIRTGLVITLAAMVLPVIFALVYRPWIDPCQCETRTEVLSWVATMCGPNPKETT